MLSRQGREMGKIAKTVNKTSYLWYIQENIMKYCNPFRLEIKPYRVAL